MSSTEAYLAFFRKLVIVTLTLTYLLILIGSGVRASGSGMGCPDWPTCFGKLIPPVSESQLPDNYREVYADRGYANQPFNASKTWIEFGNRLFGVITGLLVTMVCLYSIVFLRRHLNLLILAITTLVITGFQGWLGSVVVSSNLHPLVISSHMMLALVMITCLHSLLEITYKPKRLSDSGILKAVLFLTVFLLIIQVALGVGIREQIDSASVLLGIDNRHKWIDALDGSFSVHMAFALCLLSSAAVCLWIMIRKGWTDTFSPFLILWLVSLAGSLVSGLIMLLFSVFPLVQPPHLLFASVQFGMLYHIIFRLARCHAPGVLVR